MSIDKIGVFKNKNYRKKITKRSSKKIIFFFFGGQGREQKKKIIKDKFLGKVFTNNGYNFLKISIKMAKYLKKFKDFRDLIF